MILLKKCLTIGESKKINKNYLSINANTQDHVKCINLESDGFMFFVSYSLNDRGKTVTYRATEKGKLMFRGVK